MVGRPRPNYAALRALVEYGGTGASSFKVKWVSFARGAAAVVVWIRERLNLLGALERVSWVQLCCGFVFARRPRV